MLTDLDAITGFSREPLSSQAASVHHATAVLFGLPALRQAALVQLAVSIGKAVNTEMKADDSNAEGQADVVAAIRVACDTILQQLESNMEGWAQVLFEWSLNVLAEVSYNHPGASTESAGGNKMTERISHWTSCPPTGPVVEVATRSMAYRMKQDPVSCVHNLVSSVRAMSPHLDWILALATGMFSSSLVPALLCSGLKDFHQGLTAAVASNRSAQSSRASPISLSGVGVPAAIVHILVHLLKQHGDEVRSALVNFFKASLARSSDEEQLLAVPYLLHLALECPQILQLVLSDIVACMSPDVVKVLYEQYCTRNSKWPRLREAENLRTLLKRLQASLEPTLLLLLQLASPNELDVLPSAAQANLRQFLEQFISDLQFSVMRHIARRGSTTGDDTPVVLLALRSSEQFLLNRVLPEDHGVRPCALSYELLRLTGLCSGETWCANLLSSILLQPPSHRNHSLFVDLHKHFSSVFISVLTTCLERLFTRILLLVSPAGALPSNKGVMAVMNLDQLCKHETENTFSTRCTMHLAEHLPLHAVKLCRMTQSPLGNPQLSSAALSVLHQLPSLCCIPPDQPSFSDSTACSVALISCYSQLCPSSPARCPSPRINGSNGVTAETEGSLARQSHQCRQVLTRLAERHTGMQPLLMRMLIEGCPAGAVPQASTQTNGAASNSVSSNRVSLLDASYRHCATTTPAPPASAAAAVKARFMERQLRLSTDSHQSHSSDDGGEYCVESLRALDHYTHALCVVARVTPPVVVPPSGSAPSALPPPLPPSSGLPVLASILLDIILDSCGILLPAVQTWRWPEEDGLKHSQRNDISVLRCFESDPIMWQGLFLLQLDVTSFTAVFPVLRSLLATQLTFWQRWRQLEIHQCTQQLRVTRDTIYLMAKAKWLPAQLMHSTNILPHISPAEVHSIVSAAWMYLKGTWQQQQQQQDPGVVVGLHKAVTATLTGIAVDNMAKVGHFYHLLS